MPLSFPRYTFFSEFMGAGQTGRLGETAALKRKKKKMSNIEQWTARGGRERERARGEREKRGRKKALLTLSSPQWSKESGLADFPLLRLDKRLPAERFQRCMLPGLVSLHARLLEQAVAGLLQSSPWADCAEESPSLQRSRSCYPLMWSSQRSFSFSPALSGCSSVTS